MPKLGSPFRRGTLSSIILGVILTIALVYFYFESETRSSLFYVLILVALGSTAVDVFKYRKLADQNGTSLIGDSD